MRKTLIASTTACLLAASLTGCGNQSNSKQVGEKLDLLLEQMGRLNEASLPTASNKRHYSNGHEVGGVVVPGSLSPEAAYIDQTLALLPLAQQIASTGSDRQKQAANAIISSILADESTYLIAVAQESYQSGVAQVSSLRNQVGMLRDINTLINELAGDRSAIIDTIRTGQVGDGTTVQGINQLQTESKDAAAVASSANTKLTDINGRIEALQAKVAEYESLELQLSNQALSAQGAVKYDKLDQATTAEYEARLADANAEGLGLDAQIQSDQAALATGRQTRSDQVIASLEEKIDQIEAEKRLVADKLAELQKAGKDGLATLDSAFTRLDGQIQARAFARMAKAQKQLEQANLAAGLAQLGRAGQLEQMSLYTQQARALHQQALAARSYAAVLQSIVAAGPDVLGGALLGKLNARIANMDALLVTVGQAAKKLDDVAGDTVSMLENRVDLDSPEGAVAAEQVRIYRSLLSSIQ